MSAANALQAPPEAAAHRKTVNPASDDFAWRVLTLLNWFRVCLALALSAVFIAVREPHLIGNSDERLAFAAMLGMLAAGGAGLLLQYRRLAGASVQIYLQFGADLIVIIALMHASGGISSGFGGLLIISVGALALLVRADRAFMLAAVTTLALLLEQSLARIQELTTSAQFTQTGLLGAIVFVGTAAMQLLRRQFIETEALAEQRGIDLKNLVELNEYIIQHLRESIVVVDERDCIRLINGSAVKLLGADTDAAGLGLQRVSPELNAKLKAWRDSGLDAGRIDTLAGAADEPARIQPHFASLGSGRHGGVVIFLEDMSLIAERVQQAKLAALGRLSASIAHEIRNPLGAMSHAGQLLAESASIGSDDRRLTDIIRVNSRRVSQIVESVLALSRRETTSPERIQLRRWCINFANEFMQTQELYEGAVALMDGPEEFEVRMDPTHLHQVLWNLCDNAIKYASETAGAISVELSYGYSESSGRPYLDVADRGPGISNAQVEQVFEPFYTGQPGGTGLGLYICRELCERNGASVRYRSRPGGGSIFRVLFADPSYWQMDEEAG